MKLTKLCNKLPIASGSVTTQLTHTWIIQWHLRQWVFLSHFDVCPFSDNTWNVIHCGQITLFFFKLHPVLVNLLKVKFASWFIVLLFLRCPCVFRPSNKYLFASLSLCVHIYWVRDMQMRKSNPASDCCWCGKYKGVREINRTGEAPWRKGPQSPDLKNEWKLSKEEEKGMHSFSVAEYTGPQTPWLINNIMLSWSSWVRSLIHLNWVLCTGSHKATVWWWPGCIHLWGWGFSSSPCRLLSEFSSLWF